MMAFAMVGEIMCRSLALCGNNGQKGACRCNDQVERNLGGHFREKERQMIKA